MSKPIRNSLLTLLVLVLALWVAGWYIAGSKTVETTQALITKLNNRLHADGTTAKLTYDALERTGFPSIGVRFVNPVLSLELPAGAMNKAPFTATWKRTGTIDVVTDYLTHEYRLTSHGTGQLDLKTGEQTASVVSADSTLKASLRATSFRAFNQWNHLDFNDQAALRTAALAVARFTVDTGPLNLKDATSGEPMFTQDVMKLTLNNRSRPERFDFDLDAEVKGSLVTPAYSAMVDRLVAALEPNMPAGNVEAMPFSASRAGKEDIQLALSVNIPSDTGTPMTDGAVHVTKFSLSNDFYRVELPLSIDLDQKDGMRHATVKTNFSLTATPAGAQEMQQAIDGAIGYAVGPVPPSKADMLAAKAKINEALPTLSTLGPVTLRIDLEAAVPAERVDHPADDHETITVRQFALEHKRWGITLDGHAQRNAKEGVQMDLKLLCKQCHVLTQDLATSLVAGQEAFNLLRPDRPQKFVDAELPARLDAMIDNLGVKKGESDVLFAITTPAASDVRINDKPFMAAMAEVTAAFMPPPPAPTTITPASTPAKPAQPAATQPVTPANPAPVQPMVTPIPVPVPARP